MKLASHNIMKDMRFTLHDNVFDLLIGNNLYKSAYTAIRELLQNAEDACSLQKIKYPSYSPNILVRYSVAENWVEITDDGLGMNKESLQKSFATVGASKQDVPHIQALLKQSGNKNFQIGKFGIGILSCFGVADRVEVKTKMEEETGIAFAVMGPKEKFVEITDIPTLRGTSVKLLLKPSGAMNANQVSDAVEQYARHASFIEIEKVDTQEKKKVTEKWKGANIEGAIEVKDSSVISGFLALDNTWESAGATIQSSLTICNGGFLVLDNDKTLISQHAVGYIGEIDVLPGGLNILMSRDGFQPDDKWQELGKRLLSFYNQLVRKKIGEIEKSLEDDPKGVDMGQIDKYVAILYYGQTKSILDNDILQKLENLLPKVIRVRELGVDKRLSVKAIIDKAKDTKRLYYVREEEAVKQFQQSIQQGSSSAQITESVQTRDIRIAHLLLRGELVIRCQNRTFPVEINGQTQNVNFHEADILSQECSKNSYRWIHVDEATLEEVMLEPIAESELFSLLLGLEQEFKLVDLPDTTDRVIRDVGGKLMNFSSKEVQEILKIIPEVAGNPVRRQLLQVYLDLDSAYGTVSAQRKIKKLLTDPELHEKAQLSTSPLLKEFLKNKIDELIKKEERKE